MTTEFDVQSSGSEPMDGDATVQVCGACGHTGLSHDAIAKRFCRASRDRALDRVCVCTTEFRRRKANDTQAARSGDPRRPCTGAVDPAERKVSPLRLARVPSAEHAGGGFSSLSRGLDQGAARGEFGSRAPPRSRWLLGRTPIFALVSLR